MGVSSADLREVRIHGSEHLQGAPRRRGCSILARRLESGPLQPTDERVSVYPFRRGCRVGYSGGGMRKGNLLAGAILLVFLTSGWWLPRFMWETPFEPSGEESQRIGWYDPLSVNDIAWDIHLRVNDERTARGLAALVWDEQLAALARQWSEEMIRTGVFAHSPDGFRYHATYPGTGENIHMGTRGATDAHVAWMTSDGHRDNLLDPAFEAMGVGVVCREDGYLWATQIFGAAARAAMVGATPGTSVEPLLRRDDGPMCPSRRGLFVP